MAAPSNVTPAGQLANVSAALVAANASANSSARDEATFEQARLLARLFEDVVLVGAGGAQFGRQIEPAGGESGFGAALAAALDAAREDRVLVLDANGPPVSAALILAMTAWPEHECVAPGDSANVNPRCILVQREAALARTRDAAWPASASFDEVIATFDCAYITGSDLAQLLR